jgi:hypothetical protein
MFNIRTELPSGAISRGYDRTTVESAEFTFTRVVSQCKAMKDYVIDVVMTDDGVELQREHIENA